MHDKRVVDGQTIFHLYTSWKVSKNSVRLQGAFTPCATIFLDRRVRRMAEPFRFLSLGGGRQSITLYRLSDHGILPRLDGAIFADTQAEPQYVYDTLDDLIATSSGTIPIYRVTAGHLGQDTLDVAQQHKDGKRL